MKTTIDNTEFMKFFSIALTIMIGVLMVDHAIDERASAALKNIGMMLFMGGWLVMTWYTFDNWYLTVGSLGILASIMMLVMLPGMFPRYRGTIVTVSGALFALFWLVFAFGIAGDDIDNSTKAWLSYGGTALIIASMMLLFRYRKFDVRSNMHTGPGYVYNPGLVMFGMGWVAVSMAYSME